MFDWLLLGLWFATRFCCLLVEFGVVNYCFRDDLDCVCCFRVWVRLMGVYVCFVDWYVWFALWICFVVGFGFALFLFLVVV